MGFHGNCSCVFMSSCENDPMCILLTLQVLVALLGLIGNVLSFIILSTQVCKIHSYVTKSAHKKWISEKIKDGDVFIIALQAVHKTFHNLLLILNMFDMVSCI